MRRRRRPLRGPGWGGVGWGTAARRRVKRGSAQGLAPAAPGGRLELLTFSVSRSFTVGNGVRADILCGRRGRAGVSPARLGCGPGGERKGVRARGRAERLPQAAGRCNKRPRRGEGEEDAEEGEGEPLPAAAPAGDAGKSEGGLRARAVARRGPGGEAGGMRRRGEGGRRGRGAGGRRPGPASLPGPWLKVSSPRKSLPGSSRRARLGPGSRGPDSAARAAPRAPPQVCGAARPSRSHAPGAQRRRRPGSRRARPGC